MEYIQDIDQYIFIEENLRGGTTTINQRLFTANNKFLDDYDADKPSSFINYIDCNNLYGSGMMKKLPIANYRFLNPEEFENTFSAQENFLNIDPDGDTCYIIYADWHIPDSLHDLLTDYPPSS